MPGESNNRIFVAGAGGAIGRPLCLLLVQDGWHVTGTTRRVDRAAALRAMGVEPAIVDVYDEKALRDAVAAAQPAVVIHQLTDLPQGLDPAKMANARAANARIRDIGTRNLIDAALASGVKRMIVQSIAFAYAEGSMPHDEDAPLASDSLAAFEAQVLRAPLEGIVLRYGRFYGPGTGIDHAPRGGPVHVDAAADAARRALNRGAPGVYNVAEDDGTVAIVKAVDHLGWNPDFRCDRSPPPSTREGA
jgi:nucleoside-diphosphate-sugar epimerase